LFEGCGTEPPRAVALNIDDAYGRELLALSKKKSEQVFTYGLASGDFHAEAVEITPRGTRFDMATPAGKIPIWSPLIGNVNVYNILAASAAGFARLGNAGATSENKISADKSVRTTQFCEAIARGIADLARVPGRFERVDCGQPFTVVVDYAHTDDALRNLTALARDFVTRSSITQSGSGGATGAPARLAANGAGKVITLFGCGGDRDRTKRPLMGEAAGKGSDFVVLTSDNPRSEDPLAIMNDAAIGLGKTGTKYMMEPDRRKAIALALGQATPGDIVLLAGRGHEQVQTTREGTIPFDDVAVAREALASMGYTGTAATVGQGTKA
jgi:UDP-N-acetylmuramoyl-L-alanyl-D-glutamate--2,6-diaminopimelate ligase